MHQSLHTYYQNDHLNKFIMKILLYSPFFPDEKIEVQEAKFPQGYTNIK